MSESCILWTPFFPLMEILTSKLSSRTLYRFNLEFNYVFQTCHARLCHTAVTVKEATGHETFDKIIFKKPSLKTRSALTDFLNQTPKKGDKWKYKGTFKTIHKYRLQKCMDTHVRTHRVYFKWVHLISVKGNSLFFHKLNRP